MAERTLSDGAGSPNENLPQYLEHARSLTFLGRNDLALDELTPSLLSNMSDRIRRTFSRQAADVSLLLGDPGPHVELLPTDLDPHVRAAEAAFDELVRGRRIAIVGPGQSDLGSGAEIDDHDVVIRTKFVSDQLDDHVAMAGSRTDVSYYALGSAQFMRADIIEAIETGGLKMAVFRSATYTPDPPYLVRPGDIRYVPSEFTAGLRASQFAIQRIFYDLLRYGPASIKVFNIDFFLSLDSYRPGYLAEYANRAEQQGFIKVLGAFGHDFLADFRFTRAMHRFGLLDVDANVERILELEPDEYLRAPSIDEAERPEPSANRSTTSGAWRRPRRRTTALSCGRGTGGSNPSDRTPDRPPPHKEHTFHE